MTVDLNCDLGEGMANDAAIMPYISSANIACGYHAGDEATMHQTIELCLANQVAIGAHPGFNDKENFGRVALKLSYEELYSLVSKQLEVLDSVCHTLNAQLHHVKPHGALYNMAATDKLISAPIVQAVKDYNKNLIFVGLSGSQMIKEATQIGLQTASEVFADRTYQADGTLTPRSEKNALITSTSGSLKQVMDMIGKKWVRTVQGKIISIQSDTVCLHGDGEHAVAFAKEIHSYLVSNNITIKPLQTQ